MLHDATGVDLMDEFQHPFSEKIAGRVDSANQRYEQDQGAKPIYQEFEHGCFLGQPLTGRHCRRAIFTGTQTETACPIDATYRHSRVRIHPPTTTIAEARQKSVGVALSQNTIRRSQT